MKFQFLPKKAKKKKKKKRKKPTKFSRINWCLKAATKGEVSDYDVETLGGRFN